ncbi:Zinc finger protein [Pseudolycoriella hygida]|uniref:Zinc finger protein n=1 Tax=Pseudolycoriella hygida TaxID=35572 RepID=A0A9Q0S7Q4_9DIPT|nr:Zinc finger protein [Pseudolycoriella hygida]
MDPFHKTITTTISSVDLSRLAHQTEDGTFQFITMPPRSIEQEYIDHSLLNPDYLGDNALVVDLLQTTNGNAFQTSERQFLTENELVGEVQIHPDLNEVGDSRVKQVLLQYINKAYQNPNQIITSDQVVNIKHVEPEMPPLTPIRNHYNYQRAIPQKDIPFHTIQLLKDKTDEDGRSLKQFDYDDTESNRLAIKKNLPHKKRIVKIISKKGVDNKTLLNPNTRDNACSTKYTCELCGFQISDQLSFFSHLKLHYEPPGATIEEQAIDSEIVQTDEISLPVLKLENLSNEITEHDSSTIDDDDVDNCEFESSVEFHTGNILHANDKSSIIENANDEFSDTEDMLEGIRSVVDKVQQSVDNDLISISENTKDWFDSHESLTPSFESETRDNAVRKQNDDLYGNISTTGIISMNEMSGDQVVIYESQLTQSSILQNELDKTTKDEVDVKPMLTLREMRENYVEEREEDDVESKKSKGRKKIYVCKVCEKVCNSRNALHYHFLSHSGERPHVCEECGKRFYSISALKVHRRVHTLEKPFSCDYCGRAFRQWGDLSYHITSIHTEDKSHTCEFCGKGFKRRYSLVIHRRIHTNERNYKCEFCNKAFRASSYLQDHRKIHTGEKNHKCPTCGKLFRVRGDLKRHLKIHLRLIEKEQAQTCKNEVAIVENVVILEDACNNAAGYKIKYNKPSDDDNLKPSEIYGDVANGDIFNESLLSEVTATVTNNNVEHTNLLSTRKRKLTKTKQRKGVMQENMHGDLSTTVLQMPATVESPENLISSIPVDINKIMQKEDKGDASIVSVAEQYEIYLLGA